MAARRAARESAAKSAGAVKVVGARATRVIIVHKDSNGTDADVRVVTGGASGADASLARLSASAVTDARGVSFGGFTLDGVQDGVPVPGGPPIEHVAAAAGTYSFTVYKGTAAVLTF